MVGPGDADGVEQDEVAAAEPSIDEKTAKLVSRGRWSVPGYKVGHASPRLAASIHLVLANASTQEKFGDLSVL